MAKYCIEYHEHSVGYFDVEAESEKEALETFEYYLQEGAIDFRHMEVEECSAVATLDEKGETE